eukprot:g16530.t1
MCSPPWRLEECTFSVFVNFKLSSIDQMIEGGTENCSSLFSTMLTPAPVYLLAFFGLSRRPSRHDWMWTGFLLLAGVCLLLLAAFLPPEAGGQTPFAYGASCTVLGFGMVRLLAHLYVINGGSCSWFQADRPDTDQVHPLGTLHL